MAEWIKSEEAGFAPGRLLLDTTNGYWVITPLQKRGYKFLVSHVSGGIAEFSAKFGTIEKAKIYVEGGLKK